MEVQPAESRSTHGQVGSGRILFPLEGESCRAQKNWFARRYPQGFSYFLSRSTASALAPSEYGALLELDELVAMVLQLQSIVEKAAKSEARKHASSS